MGRKKQGEVAPSTLRWRKYQEKKILLDPNYHDENKERVRIGKRNRIGSETSVQKIVRLAANKESKRKHRSAVLQEANQNQSYCSPNTLGKAINRTLASLPNDRAKSVTVLRKVVKKLGVLKEQLFPPNSTIPDNHQLVIDFYYNPRISYTMPGIADTMVIKTSEGKVTVRKHFLTVFIKEAYAMFTEMYGPIVKRTLFYDLRPKNVLLMKDTPKDVCKCLYHENLRFMFLALGGNYDGSYWDEILCDSNLRSGCWSNTCGSCKDFGYVFPDKDLLSTTKLQQWKKNAFNQMRLASETVTVAEVLERLQSSAPSIYHHVHVKRVQSLSFDLDKQMPFTRVLQFDFSMNYGSEVQTEVQSALWGRASIILFTVASKLNDSDLSMVCASNGVAKDKRTVFAFLYQVLSRLPNITDPSIHEIWWSDGPSSEFKNKFMFAVLKFFAMKYQKTFTWKYFATSHGKGVVDAIGGNVKSIVRMQQRAHTNEILTCDTATDFIRIARTGIKNTLLFEVSAEQVDLLNNTYPIFNNVQPIPGIHKVHVIRCTKEGKFEFVCNALHIDDFSN